MHLRSAAAATLGCLVAAAVLAAPLPAAASGVSVKVAPNRGLVNGQFVTISGRGLARTADGKPLTWFAVECTAAVMGRLRPLHRHAALRHHRRPGAAGGTQRHVHGPFPGHGPASSATATAGRRATPPASSA